MEKYLIWHDPNAFNQENNIYYEKISKEFAESRRFSSFTDVVGFLRNERKRWIVITSGNKGKELIDQIKQLPSVLSVVIFCKNKEFHENWSKNYPIVKGLFSDFDTLMQKVKTIHEEFIKHIVNLDFERQKQQLQQQFIDYELQLQLQNIQIEEFSIPKIQTLSGLKIGQEILKDLKIIPTTQSPGSIKLNSKNHAVLTGPNTNEVILAAANCGDGKIFVAADDCYLKWIHEKNEGAIKSFMKNVRDWLCGPNLNDSEIIDLNDKDNQEFTGYKLIKWYDDTHISQSKEAKLLSFILNGGALFCGSTPWRYLENNPNRTLKNIGMFYFLLDTFGMVYTVNRLQLTSNEIHLNLIDQENNQEISNKTLEFTNPYHRVIEDLETEFRIVVENCLNRETIDSFRVLNEFKQLALYQKNEIEDIFKKNWLLAKRIFHLYTTNYIYRPFNKCFAEKELHKIFNAIAAFYKEMFGLKKLQDERIITNRRLYRGLPVDVSGDYVAGKDYFWPAFSSSSTEEAIAKERFANHQGTIFEIDLIDHPCVELKDWSSYTSEKEALIFPYFAFTVVSSSNRCVKIKQNSAKNVISFETNKVEEYWNEKVIPEKLNNYLNHLFKESISHIKIATESAAKNIFSKNILYELLSKSKLKDLDFEISPDQKQIKIIKSEFELIIVDPDSLERTQTIQTNYLSNKSPNESYTQLFPEYSNRSTFILKKYCSEKVSCENKTAASVLTSTKYSESILIPNDYDLFQSYFFRNLIQDLLRNIFGKIFFYLKQKVKTNLCRLCEELANSFSLIEQKNEMSKKMHSEHNFEQLIDMFFYYLSCESINKVLESLNANYFKFKTEVLTEIEIVEFLSILSSSFVQSLSNVSETLVKSLESNAIAECLKKAPEEYFIMPLMKDAIKLRHDIFGEFASFIYVGNYSKKQGIYSTCSMSSQESSWLHSSDVTSQQNVKKKFYEFQH